MVIDDTHLWSHGFHDHFGVSASGLGVNVGGGFRDAEAPSV